MDPFMGEAIPANSAVTSGASFHDLFSSELLLLTTAAKRESLAVELVDAVVYKIPLRSDAPVIVQMPTLVQRDFADKKEFVLAAKIYLKRVRQRVAGDHGPERAKAFMAGANAFVQRALQHFDDLEFYAGRDSGGNPGEAMAIVCHYLDGLQPRLLLWADGCIVVAATEPEPEPEIDGPVEFACCTYHHLLAGKEHQKEKDMVSAAKSMGLVGAILYGTPGIVVIEDETGDGVTSFMKESRKIGKKGDVTLSVQLPLGGEAGSGTGLFGERRLVPITMNQLKELLTKIGQGEQYRTVLGL
eukprot:CAMPEP_0194306994 /NCGR_PEP_ID=MMETSP0171-20130528/3916_1 /TAXON_ID=218684 /ORGANISM="Corethron pennatum, Strain L29A3" /LENGTH=299 /DNA_ID=CAMNT_0039058863 /DNA_START=8 /DNA_END=907 /DNA_ORIENTATION=+